MAEQQSVRRGRIRLGIGVAFASLLCAACAYAQTQAPTTAVPVGVVVAEKQPVARSAEFVGRIEAPSRVEVRARVTGYLDAVLFKEGERVREGDLLYRIDQAPFQAAVQQAQGACCAPKRLTRTPRSRQPAPRNWSRPAPHRLPSGTGGWLSGRAARATS